MMQHPSSQHDVKIPVYFRICVDFFWGKTSSNFIKNFITPRLNNMVMMFVFFGECLERNARFETSSKLHHRQTSSKLHRLGVC
jgi:hypothetical protein